MLKTATTASPDLSRDDSAKAGSLRKNLLPAMIGNVLEYYDFVVYAFLATTLARNFFQGDALGGLLATFATFGVGFLARPVGGAIFGALADRHGRRVALSLTIIGMAIGTVGIGLLPTYSQIGVLAPVLLVTLRLIQGLAAGGEWGTAAAFIVESAPAEKRGFFGAMGQASITASALVSSLVALAVNSAFTPAEMDSWGWRVPFLLGGVLLPVGMYMRRNLEETPAFLAAKDAPAAVAAPADTGSGLGSMATLFFINIINTVAYYLMLSYMPTFLGKYANLSSVQSLTSNTIALAVLILATPFVGMLSDKIGRKPFLLACCFGFTALTYALFHLILSGISFPLIVLVQVFLNLILACYSGVGVATFCELFPTHRRTLMLSVSYSLSTAIFGGFAPFISTWLISVTGNPIAPAYYVTGAAVVSGIAVLRMRETAHVRLR